MQSTINANDPPSFSSHMTVMDRGRQCPRGFPQSRRQTAEVTALSHHQGVYLKLRLPSMHLQGQVHVAVRKLLAAYSDSVGSITVTGHSLGGALATQCAFDIVRCPLLM